MIELYIEKKKVDITKDISIAFTYETIDPDKLSSIKNSFSKTVELPGTKTNNEIFGNIFKQDRYVSSDLSADYLGEYNNVGYQFDPHRKADYVLIENGVIINSGYCTLNEIVVKDKEFVTYKLTLYGGIGNFFYNLSYNEDGTPKTLKDMRWSWNSVLSVTDDGDGTPMSYQDENSGTMLVCSPAIICKAYSSLSPEERIIRYTTQFNNPDFYNNDYGQFYPFTRIDRDVTFIPSYTGLYDDFDSNKMLVNVENSMDYETPPPDPSTYMSDSTIDIFRNSFPVGQLVMDEESGVSRLYTTLNSDMLPPEESLTSDFNSYGIATFSRDLDCWEAGDIRINEMPVALRLSKILRTASMPWNNGGYTVEWDDDITNSPYWKYSWLTLGKLSQEDNSPTIGTVELQNFNNVCKYEYLGYPDGDSGHPEIWGGIPTSTNNVFVGTLDAGNYNARIAVKPIIYLDSNEIKNSILKHPEEYTFTSSDYKYDHGDKYYRQNIFVLLHKVMLNGTTYKTVLDIYYPTSDMSVSNFGKGLEDANILIYGGSGVPEARSIKYRIENYFGITIDDISIHNLKVKINKKIETIDGIDFITAFSSNQDININITADSSSSIVISQTLFSMFVDYRITPNSIIAGCGIWCIDLPSSVQPDWRPKNYFSFIDSNGNYQFYKYGEDSTIDVMFSFNDYEPRTIFTSVDNTGFSEIRLTKNILLTETETPMKYLTDFCKILNLRFIVDDNLKKIYIKTLKNYYIHKTERAFDLVYDRDKTLNVDYSRDISIKNITTKYKRIDFGLESLETYPISLYNRLSTDKFNTYKYTTNVEWNQETTQLLSDLKYKNAMEWQLNSPFFKNYPQMPRPYNTNTISWTLFDSQTSDEIVQKEFFTPGTTDIMVNTKDVLPKLAFFEKDQKYTDGTGTLVFLNGFTRNFGYNFVETVFTQDGRRDRYAIYPFVSFSEDYPIQYYLNDNRCYIYDFSYRNNEFLPWGSYSNRGTAASWTLPYFSRDLFNSYNPVGKEREIEPNAKVEGMYFTIEDGVYTTHNDTNWQIWIYYVGDVWRTPAPHLTAQYPTPADFTGYAIAMYDRNGNLNGQRLDIDDDHYEYDRQGFQLNEGVVEIRLNVYAPNTSTTFLEATKLVNYKWEYNGYTYASWNLVYQNGINSNEYSNTRFITNPGYNYPKVIMINEGDPFEYQNEYQIANPPTESANTVYERLWNDYMNDLYDINTRDVTAYVDLTTLGLPTDILRGIYKWEGFRWIITKIDSMKTNNIGNDKFTKCTFHRIKNLSTWTNL